MKFALRWTAAWCAGLVMWLWRWTCRYRVENDPRPELRKSGTPYVYAILHAQQLAAVMLNDDRGLQAMVSRSFDGDLLVPFLYLRGVHPVRGSTRKADQDKGGRAALETLRNGLTRGAPVVLAVDGPRGPRGKVHRGVFLLAEQTGAVVLPTVVSSSRKWTLKKSWDQFEIPQPFSRITMKFDDPIVAIDHETQRPLLEKTLKKLEQPR